MKKFIIFIVSAIFTLTTFTYPIVGYEMKDTAVLSNKSRSKHYNHIASALKINNKKVITKDIKNNTNIKKENVKRNYHIKKNYPLTNNITKDKKEKKSYKKTSLDIKPTPYKNYNFIIKLCNSGNDVLRDINRLSCQSKGPQFLETDNNNLEFTYSSIPAPFDTLESFNSKLNPYFTKNYINNLEKSRFFRNVDGQTYFLLGQPGMKYNYNYMDIIKIENKGDILEATCNTEIKYDKKYTTKVILKKDNGSYKIDSFDSILD